MDPPETIEELVEHAEFFSGKDHNNDGVVDWGICLNTQVSLNMQHSHAASDFWPAELLYGFLGSHSTDNNTRVHSQWLICVMHWGSDRAECVLQRDKHGAACAKRRLSLCYQAASPLDPSFQL